MIFKNSHRTRIWKNLFPIRIFQSNFTVYSKQENMNNICLHCWNKIWGKKNPFKNCVADFNFFFHQKELIFRQLQKLGTKIFTKTCKCKDALQSKWIFMSPDNLYGLVHIPHDSTPGSASCLRLLLIHFND